MTDFIERLRAKPEHVRKHIALGTAGSITGVVALAWMISFSASGSFALSPIPKNEGGASASFAQAGSPSLFAAVGALVKAETTDLIEVVETRASSTVAAPRPEERTVIPF